MKIVVFIQKDNEKISRNSLETLAGVQKLDGVSEVVAVTFNEDTANLTSQYNVAKVLCVTNDELQNYNPLHFTTTMEKIINSESPDIVAFGHTYQARDWVPRLSARLDVPFISDCTELSLEEKAIFTRQVYQGKINADLYGDGLLLVSVQSGSYRADEIESGKSNIEMIDVDLSSVDNSIRPGEKFQETKGGVDLTRADVVVCVGRGIGKEENIPLMEELTSALNAELGSSRPVVDYGWLPHERQVGSSGQSVTPKMYLAVGISGAVQHQVGMKGSDNIVAINKDGNAPIFEIADYGVIGYLFEIIPKLTDSIKDFKS